MNNKILIHISLLTAFFVSLFFFLFPSYDIQVSRYFSAIDNSFIGKSNDIVSVIFYSVPFLSKLFTSICVAFAVISMIKKRAETLKGNIKNLLISKCFYLLFTLAVGPALIVNYGLKENFGRARPYQIKEFNGDKQFTRAFIISDQCESNCSFSSGHAAMAFYFTALAFVARAALFNVIFIGGIIFGSLVGYIRIIMGGHFISDVVVSALIVILTNYLVYLQWEKFKKNQNQSP